MSTAPDSLNLKTGFLSLLVVSVLAGGLVAGMTFASQRRAQAIIADYERETTTVMNAQPSKTADFFDKVFTVCRQAYEVKNAKDNQQEPVDCPEAASALASLGTINWRDSSAVAYVKVVKDYYELIEASGSYRRFPIQDYNALSSDAKAQGDLRRFIVQHQPINRWQNFIFYLPAKQVIVPIEQNGQPLGYVFRTVIE